MPKGILVTIKDIRAVFGCKEGAAIKIKRRCLDSIGKKTKNLTIIEFCKNEEIDIKEFNQAVISI